MKTRINRRSWLRGVGATALALPFLEHYQGSAEAYEAPKRILFFITRNGTDPTKIWPTGSGTDFTLGPIMAPLVPYKNRMILMRGVDNMAATATGVNGHTDAVRCMLTGRIAANKENGDYTAGGGISVDQVIANQVGAGTIFKSLQVMDHYYYSNPTNYVSFYDAGQPLPFEHSAPDFFNTVFGQFTPQDPTAALHLKEDRQSVLHSVYDDYARLRSRVGVADRDRLEAHLQRVHDLETRLTAQLPANCSVPAAPDSNPTDDGQRASKIGVLTQALACDLTRVATWGNTTYGFNFLGIQGSYHDDYLHHVVDGTVPDAPANVMKVKTWECQQLISLIQALEAVPEGTGTLFDNTLVVWADEFCHGYQHKHNEVPYVLLSGKDRFFTMGNYIQYPTAVGNNQLWLSLMKAMDVTGSFGDPQFGSAPLSELV